MSFSSLPNSSCVSARRAGLWKLPGLWKSLRDSHNPLENPQTGFPQFRTAPTTSRSEKEREAHSGLQPLLSLRRSLEPRESGSITVRQEIREIFLVSDNQAYNYLYEMVGQDGLAESLDRAGLTAPRIVHRLSEFRTPEEHRQLPEIVFIGLDFKHTLPRRTTEPLPPREQVPRITVGRGYYSGDELVEEPMDFSTKNYISLVDLQRGLCKLVRPDVDCGGPAFELSDADRDVMLQAMSQYPRQSKNPKYDPEDYPDEYVKDLLPGLERVVPKKQLTIFNKTGQAYGFSTENAWVVNNATGDGFFLAATLYTNADGILNDDEYEYDEIARPFMADLGEAVARQLWNTKDQ